MLAEVAAEVAVVVPEEGAVTERRDAAAETVTEGGGRPVGDGAAGIRQPAREVDVLEPSGVEGGIEAAEPFPSRAAQRQRRGRRLLDASAGRRLHRGAAAGVAEQRVLQQLQEPRQGPQ